MNFNITKEDHEKIDKWFEEEVYPAIIEKQKETYKDNPMVLSWIEQTKRPYGGAIGGGLTYEFTPTSLGLGYGVTESWTKKHLNLTDYNSW